MNENLRSILVGTSGLSAAAFVALLLTILRRSRDGKELFYVSDDNKVMAVPS